MILKFDVTKRDKDTIAKECTFAPKTNHSTIQPRINNGRSKSSYYEGGGGGSVILGSNSQYLKSQISTASPMKSARSFTNHYVDNAAMAEKMVIHQRHI
jgi:hypothetical protein